MYISYIGEYIHNVHVLFLSILAIEELACARVFMLVSTAGHIALFPLLYQPTGERCCMLNNPWLCSYIPLSLYRAAS